MKKYETKRLMQTVEARVTEQCGDKLGQAVVREVRADLILPKLNLLKGTKIFCQIITDDIGEYVRLVIGPRDFTFNAGTGARESSGMVMTKTANT